MATGKKIRVVIVDDSLFFREFLARALLKDGTIEVAGSFGDPSEAVKKLSQLNPDVLAVDMEMPNMRGPEFLRATLPRFPKVKAIVISALSSNVFEALSAGAIDFVSKPNTRPNYSNADFSKEVISKIKIAAAATTRPAARAASAAAQARSAVGSDATARPSAPTVLKATSSKRIVAIGASTGGTEAILEVVKTFPANMSGVVIVQHMPPVFTDMYAQRIDRVCKMRAREAKNGDRVEPGLILIAPGDKQMQLVKDARGYFVRCYEGERVSGHCPSVDVLFDSIANVARGDAVGVILTGMGSDGAKGLLKMRKSGAHTFGQDKESCVVYGMPMVAFNIGGVSEQLPISQIGDAVIRRLNK